MAKKKKHPRNFSPRIENRRARFDYDITDTLECGVKLMGSEVKSIRHGHVSLAEGYVAINPNNMGMDLINVDIGPYAQAGVHQHQPKRVRQLLAHKREVKVLYGKTTAKGVSIVPLAMYFKNGMCKVEIGLGIGKKMHDKRRDIQKAEADRDIRRAMAREVR